MKPLLKGGLKRKQNAECSTEKQEKLAVKWADENGGTLKEVYTIEVEKIKNSIASYKNYKELVKKERQFEKETHLSKVLFTFLYFLTSLINLGFPEIIFINRLEMQCRKIRNGESNYLNFYCLLLLFFIFTLFYFYILTQTTSFGSFV
jgi:hypothetical protein